ncbi:glutathione S-transferase [Mycena rebaudengoi]|nr:glutathione S-transferase [Mycena rebaudengoi]
MTLKLFGSPYSTCTKRVATVLIEKKVAFTFQSINIMTGEHKSEEFRARQPFGQVPYIDDDGFILYESRAICRYIADNYANQGPKLVPTDLKGKALFEQAASTEYSNLTPSAVFKPMMGMETNKANLEENLKTLSAKLDVYEAILGKQKYLAGNEVTLVDLFHLPYGALLEKAGSDLMTTKGPNVTRWFNDLQARESWVTVKDGISKTSY